MKTVKMIAKRALLHGTSFFAIIMLFITANTECAFIYHENEKPQSLYKYKGIRNVKKILHENSTKTIRLTYIDMHF